MVPSAEKGEGADPIPRTLWWARKKAEEVFKTPLPVRNPPPTLLQGLRDIFRDIELDFRVKWHVTNMV